MLLDDLLKSRVVQLREFCQVMNIGDDITQNLLQHQEVLVRRGRSRCRTGARSSTSLRLVLTVAQPVDHTSHLLLTSLNPTDNLIALYPLEIENLIQLALQEGDEMPFVLFRPSLTVRFGVLLCWLCDIFRLEGLLQLVVGDIIPIVVADHRRPQMLPEATSKAKKSMKERLTKIHSDRAQNHSITYRIFSKCHTHQVSQTRANNNQAAKGEKAIQLNQKGASTVSKNGWINNQSQSIQISAHRTENSRPKRTAEPTLKLKREQMKSSHWRLFGEPCDVEATYRMRLVSGSTTESNHVT